MATRRANAVTEETVENGGPIVVKSSGKAKDRVVLFTIDDKEFSVPSKPGPNITLKFLNVLRKTGNEMFAALELLEAMLGTEKYEAFLDYEELTEDLLSQVLDQVVELAMGRVEDVAGK